MRPDVDLQVQITRTSTTRRLLTLTRKANQLPISHARRNRDANCVRLHVQRAIRLQIRALQLERARSSLECLLQIDINTRMMIASGAASSSTTERAATRAPKAAAAKQRREEVAEAFCFLEFLRARSAAPGTAATLARSASELETTAPVRRGPECLSGLPFTAELVIRGPLLGILQNLVGFLDLLELLFRFGLFADVRVELAREAPVRFLDLVRSRGSGHAQNFVIVPIFHESLHASIEPHRWGRRAARARG